MVQLVMESSILRMMQIVCQADSRAGLMIVNTIDIIRIEMMFTALIEMVIRAALNCIGGTRMAVEYSSN